ncbi:MAG: hypothetical protein VX642_12650 [Bdellovibrionota bacterium]|nr:hypothetical protein [Bdellovibrionota bacterium]
MLLNLIKLDHGKEDVIQRWKAKYDLPQKSRVSLYPGFSEGLTEAVKGMQNLFPHKKKVLLIGGGHPIMESSAHYLSSEAFEVIRLSWKDFKSKEEEVIKEDFIFALYCEDHYLTGELSPIDGLQEKLEKARKYSISLSFRSHLHELHSYKEKRSFQIRLLGVSNHSVLGVYGTRLRKLAPLYLGDAYVLEQSVLEVASFDKNLEQTNMAEFSEDSFLKSDSIKAFFTKESSRLCDRYVLRLENMDAFAIKEYLIEKDPSLKASILTGSLHEWGGLRPLNWVGVDFPTYELLVLSAKDFHDKEKLVQEAYQAVKCLMSPTDNL